MKKYALLATLFVLPIAIYMFFAFGVHHFVKLPTITEKIKDITAFRTIDKRTYSLNNKISILCFPGETLLERKNTFLNLSDRIYKRFYKFEDFQMIVLLPKNKKEEGQAFLDELAIYSDISKWIFLYGEKHDIQSVFESLKTPYKLDDNIYCPQVFIIDKDRNLRGRKKSKYLGYDASAVAEVSKIMSDDVKVIIAEYRLELKKYGKKRNSILKIVE